VSYSVHGVLLVANARQRVKLVPPTTHFPIKTTVGKSLRTASPIGRSFVSSVDDDLISAIDFAVNDARGPSDAGGFWSEVPLADVVAAPCIDAAQAEPGTRGEMVAAPCVDAAQAEPGTRGEMVAAPCVDAAQAEPGTRGERADDVVHIAFGSVDDAERHVFAFAAAEASHAGAVVPAGDNMGETSVEPYDDCWGVRAALLVTGPDAAHFRADVHHPDARPTHDDYHFGDSLWAAISNASPSDA
jgi:hypothetical protein